MKVVLKYTAAHAIAFRKGDILLRKCGGAFIVAQSPMGVLSLVSLESGEEVNLVPDNLTSANWENITKLCCLTVG